MVYCDVSLHKLSLEFVVIKNPPGGILDRSGTSTVELPFITGIDWRSFNNGMRAGCLSRLTEAMCQGHLCQKGVCWALQQLFPLQRTPCSTSTDILSVRVEKTD